mgnify:FL=1
MQIGAVYSALLYVSTLLFLAAVLRHLLGRFKLPGLVAGLLAGMILAPTSLGGVLNNLLGVNIFQVNDYVDFLAEFAVILIIFAAGLEEGLAPLRSAGLLGLAGATLGALLPFAAGYVAYSSALGRDEALYIGAALAATSLAAASAILLERGVRGRGARFLTAAAAIDDVVTFILLSVVNVVVQTGHISAREAAGLIALYSVAWTAILAASLATLKLVGRRIKEEYSYEFSLLVVFGLTAIMITLGFSPIIAAFIAGVSIAEGMSRENIKKLTEALVEVFGPMFFVVVGAKSDVLGAGLKGITMGLVLTALAIAFKMAGIFPFAYLYTRDARAALAISLGMTPRGETGLAIAALGLNMGVLNDVEFTAVVFMGLLTTIIGAAAFSRVAEWIYEVSNSRS